MSIFWSGLKSTDNTAVSCGAENIEHKESCRKNDKYEN